MKTKLNQHASMRMTNWLLLRLTIGLACGAPIASALSASEDDSQKPIKSQVEGAFGLKLGDIFDTDKLVARGVDNFVGVPDPMDRKVYKFTPQKPLVPFENYYVQITPKSHKIFLIFARVSIKDQDVLGLPRDKQEQLRVVATALYNKYGKSYVTDGHSAHPTTTTDDHCTYVMFLFDEIEFTRDDAQCERAENKYRIELTGNISSAFQLLYKDYSLWNLAERERTELENEANEAKQRKAEEKAKSLDKSGI